MEKEFDATEYPERGDFEEKALGGVLTRLADHFEDAMPDTDTNYGLPGLLAELKPPQNVISIHRERGLRSQVCGPAGGADAGLPPRCSWCGDFARFAALRCSHDRAVSWCGLPVPSGPGRAPLPTLGRP